MSHCPQLVITVEGWSVHWHEKYELHLQAQPSVHKTVRSHPTHTYPSNIAPACVAWWLRWKRKILLFTCVYFPDVCDIFYRYRCQCCREILVWTGPSYPDRGLRLSRKPGGDGPVKQTESYRRQRGRDALLRLPCLQSFASENHKLEQF